MVPTANVDMTSGLIIIVLVYPPSNPLFQIASYVVSGIGVICTVVFHASVWNLDENRTDAITDTDGGVSSKSSMISDLKTVAKNPNFYIVSTNLANGHQFSKWRLIRF